VKYVEATAADVENIYTLGKEMHSESEFAEMDWDPEKVRGWLHGNVKNPDRLVLCAYDESKLVGMYVAGISQFYFGRSTLSQDFLWYVDKDYRGTRAGIKLLKMYIAWAKSRKVNRIQAGVSTGITMDRTGDLLVKMGFEKIGGLYKVDQ